MACLPSAISCLSCQCNSAPLHLQCQPGRVPRSPTRLPPRNAAANHSSSTEWGGVECAYPAAASEAATALTTDGRRKPSNEPSHVGGKARSGPSWAELYREKNERGRFENETAKEEAIRERQGMLMMNGARDSIAASLMLPAIATMPVATSVAPTAAPKTTNCVTARVMDSLAKPVVHGSVCAKGMGSAGCLSSVLPAATEGAKWWVGDWMGGWVKGGATAAAEAE